MKFRFYKLINFPHFFAAFSAARGVAPLRWEGVRTPAADDDDEQLIESTKRNQMEIYTEATRKAK